MYIEKKDRIQGGRMVIHLVNELEHAEENKDVGLVIVPGTLYRPYESNKKGFDCIINSYIIQISTSCRHKALHLDVLMKNFIEPIENWKVVYLTLSRNKSPIILPIVHGLKEKSPAVYLGFIDFQQQLAEGGESPRVRVK